MAMAIVWAAIPVRRVLKKFRRVLKKTNFLFDQTEKTVKSFLWF